MALNMLLLADADCRKQGADTYTCRAKVIYFINFKDSIDLS